MDVGYSWAGQIQEAQMLEDQRNEQAGNYDENKAISDECCREIDNLPSAYGPTPEEIVAYNARMAFYDGQAAAEKLKKVA